MDKPETHSSANLPDWIPPPRPELEKKRLEILKSYNILDTPQEESFDNITAILSDALKTPIALATFIASERQWFKSCIGLDGTEAPRDIAMCAVTILSDEVNVVKDTLKDPRFISNPFVQSEPHIRFYIGAPIIVEPGIHIGTLCAVDTVPRKHVPQSHIDIIKRLASIVVDELELRRAKLISEQANHLKTTFLANMSHEIRTPMNGIIGMTEILRNTPLNKDQLSYLDMIESSSDVLLNLINDVLDLTKIESGKMVPESIDVNLRELCEQAIESVLPLGQKKGIRIYHYIPCNIQYLVLSDPLRIRQILLNLLSNAIKFSKEGYVYLEVKPKALSDDRVEVTFSVKDTGIGISPSKRKLIFQPFQQCDPSTTREYGGTGLGLSISQRLAHFLGGDITLTSRPNHGSRFSATIPFSKSTTSFSDNNLIMSHPITQAYIYSNDTLFTSILKHYLACFGIEVKAYPIYKRHLKTIANGLLSKRSACLFVDFDDLVHNTPILTSFNDTFSPYQPRIISCHRQLHTPDKVVASSLHVRIPLKLSTVKDSLLHLEHDISRTPLPIKTLSSSNALHKHILVVEDNPINQHVAKTMLEKAGCKVTLANHGEEAVKQVKRHPNKFDLIFMDCQMPVMDGFEATQKLIEYFIKTKRAHIPIVAMTANAIKGDKEKCLSVGMDNYISKPFKPASFIKMVKRYTTQNDA